MKPMPSHKQRLFYLDWVRALATVLIVITHFNNPVLTNRPAFPNAPFGIYIRDLGISQFLIISGAALMYTYEDEEHLDLKMFFWKRFKSIYPMFWIAFAIANAYSFVVSRGSSASRAPKLSLILSLIGMDGYLSNAGLSTFYILGEWFLGFIVFFYIVFPLLRYGVLHHPWITAGLGLAAYAATLLLHPHLGQMPENLLLTTRIPGTLFRHVLRTACQHRLASGGIDCSRTPGLPGIHRPNPRQFCSYGSWHGLLPFAGLDQPLD